MIVIFKRNNLYNIIYKSDKTVDIIKVKNIEKENILVNPNHIFFDKKGNRYILSSDQSAETINPLNFESKYSPKEFKTAIESKLINDLFKNFDDKNISIDRIILLVNIFMTFMLLYFSVIRG